MSIVAETGQSLDEPNFLSKSKLANLDGTLDGTQASAGNICSRKSECYNGSEQQSGSEGWGIFWRALEENSVGKI
jgi:hypothetical protein